MTTKKIIYFTAGPVATVGELADIAALDAIALKRYDIEVRNGNGVSNAYGAGNEGCDFVAGTPPSIAPYNVTDVFDIDGEPVETDDGDTLVVKNSAASKTVNATAVVTDGVLSVSLGATDAIVSTTNSVNVKNSAASVTKSATATVASGVISGVALASTVALVTNGDTKTGVTGSGTTATITVASGVISAIALS